MCFINDICVNKTHFIYCILRAQKVEENLIRYDKIGLVGVARTDNCEIRCIVSRITSSYIMSCYVTCPLEGSSMRLISRKVVLLPLPEGPTMATF